MGFDPLTNTAASKERLEPDKLKLLLRARPFDRRDWSENCSEHLHLRIANEEPVLNRDQALDRLDLLMQATLGFGVGFCDVWAHRETIYVETDVLIISASRARTIPCFIIARTTHRLLQDLRFYLDPAPLKSERHGGST